MLVFRGVTFFLHFGSLLLFLKSSRAVILSIHNPIQLKPVPGDGKMDRATAMVGFTAM